MSNVNFRIKYDGPALASHEMDVKELSPALLALGEALEEANKVFNGGRTKVTANVKAFRDGCFGVDFNLVQSFTSSTLDLFNNHYITGALNLAEIIGVCYGTGFGLIKAIKWIKGRPIKNVIRLSSGGIKIELEDGDSAELDENVSKVFPNVKIRKSLEMIISKPLEKEGYETIEFIKDGKIEKIEKPEAAYFIAPDVVEKPIDEQEYEISLQIISVVFQEGNKWRFSDGTATFYAEVQDAEFVKRVQSHEEAFAKDDILRVFIIRKQYEVSGGIKTDYYIKKVLDHKSALNTISLPFADDQS